MTTFTMAMFGACYKKLTAFFHNMPGGFSLGLFVEPEREYVVLRGKVWYNGEWSFKTRVAEPYPVDLGVEYGRQATGSLDLRRKALANGEPVPMALDEHEGAGLMEAYCHLTEFADPWCLGCGLVDWGNGAPRGLTKKEHISYAIQQPHPLQGPLKTRATPDLVEAVRFELDHDVDELERIREEELHWWMMASIRIQPQRKQWTESAPPGIEFPVSQLHGPWWQLVIQELRWDLEDPQFMTALHEGFPYIGELPGLS